MEEKIDSLEKIKNILFYCDNNIFFHIDSIFKNNEEETQVKCSFFNSELLNYSEELINIWDESKEKANLEDKAYRPLCLAFSMKINNSNILIKKLTSDYWYTAKLINNHLLVQNNNKDYLSAEITLAGFGKVIIINGKIKFDGEKAPENISGRINNIMDLEIHNKLLKVDKLNLESLSQCKPDGIIVYRIGNANCNYIKCYKRGVLYDIGYGGRKNNNKYVSFIKAMNKIKPYYVILSHWDFDHIKGYIYANNEVYKVPWIAPDLIISINAKLLAIYLSKIGILYIINQDTISKVKMNNIKIYQGEGSDGSISHTNCSGIYTTINDTAILTGDVPYKCIKIDYLQYDFIVIPHHGANMFFNYKCNFKYNKGIAVISSDGSKNRPTKSHHAFLNKNYKIFITENEPNCYGKKGYYYNLNSKCGTWV